MKNLSLVNKFEYRMLLNMNIFHPAMSFLISRAYWVVNAYISYYLLLTSDSVDYTYFPLYLAIN